jgi:hypothetical protein
MVKIIEMDDSVTLGEQFEAEVGGSHSNEQVQRGS